MVAYHCLYHVDFYLWDGTGEWSCPERMAGGPEEEPIGPDGTAPLPTFVYPRDDLMWYGGYCRRRAHEILSRVTAAQLSRTLLRGHPHQSKTFEQLLKINLGHLREHGAQLADMVGRIGA